jgi:hypothetical protein
VVKAEWDFNGNANFQSASCAQCDGTLETATVSTTQSYSQAGTYFAALRATSQRDGDTNTNLNQISSYDFIYNLGRVRVVVH